MSSSSYDQWKTTNPDDERLGPEPEADPEAEMERQLEALEDRETGANEDDPHPPECAWESPS
jgi:hypothetical protein